jgi:hypothetical protein
MKSARVEDHLALFVVLVKPLQNPIAGEQRRYNRARKWKAASSMLFGPNFT